MYEDTTTIEAYKALYDYFNHLSKTGYMRYDTVYKLIVFLFVDEILHDYLYFNPTEEDYQIIANMMQCLYGTCLLPYPEFRRNLPFVNIDDEADRLRETEWDVLRQTQSESTRIIESNTTLAR